MDEFLTTRTTATTPHVSIFTPITEPFLIRPQSLHLIFSKIKTDGDKQFALLYTTSKKNLVLQHEQNRVKLR